MGVLLGRGRKTNRYKKKKKSPEQAMAPCDRKRLLSRDMAMDLGTANTLIYLKGEGVVLHEPSVVAYDTKSMEVLAVGEEAKSYLGRTPFNIKVVRPMANGAIEDFEITQVMIRELMGRVQKMGKFIKPKAVVCVPAGITQVEEQAVVKAAAEAGIGRLFLIEEPIAAAIGAGLDIDKNRGQMVVNIGGGVTDIAVLTLSSVAYSKTIRLGGDTMTRALMEHLLERHSMQVGENSAERCKIAAGSAAPVGGLAPYTVSGKDAVTSIPRVLLLNPDEVREAIQEPLQQIVGAVKEALEQTPPELVTDIAEDGIHLTGGGAMLRGLGMVIEKQTSIRCNLAEDPLTTVVKGTGKALENIKFYKKVFV